MKIMMSSEVEAELGLLFHNVKSGEPIVITLDKMGHPQAATPMHMYNSTVDSIVNIKIHQKRTKSMDIRFYWLQDRISQGHCNVFWKPGATNLDEYLTKNHPPHNHC